ncbi:MAG: hypothetical protein JXK07_13480 [Spirochaetes bacterium]|nr:hypothetical protein [Spirochaetota bacterium]
MTKIVCAGRIERTGRKLTILTKYDTTFFAENTAISTLYILLVLQVGEDV